MKAKLIVIANQGVCVPWGRAISTGGGGVVVVVSARGPKT